MITVQNNRVAENLVDFEQLTVGSWFLDGVQCGFKTGKYTAIFFDEDGVEEISPRLNLQCCLLRDVDVTISINR